MFRRSIKLGFVTACCLILPAAADATECTVTFGFLGDAEVSGVVIDIGYAHSGVSFVGNGEDVECHAAKQGMLATFNDADDIVNAALIRIEPFGGPTLFSCVVSGEVDESDFTVETVDASDPQSNVVSPLPQAALTGIDCGGRAGGDDTTHFCDVVFTVDSNQRVSGLVFDAGYPATLVDPVGSGDGVACKNLLPGGLGAYNDEESTATLVGAVVHVQGVEGTADIAKCRFEAPNGLNADELYITVTDAVGPTGDALAKTPNVFVGELECGTEAELGDGEGDGDDGPVDCDGDYEVTFAVSGGARLGALQVTVDYSAASGTFTGNGENVECTGDVGALAMFNDKEGLKTLTAGLISTGGFDAPTDVFTCVFEGVGRAPEAADFMIEVQDASTVEGGEVSPEPTVHVSSISGGQGNECGEPEPQCGNGIVESDEECDDADLDEEDGCLSNCSLASCGDSDGNGFVTATDAKRALNVAIGLGANCSLVRCDVNSTGTVTATDARMILNDSVGLDVPLDCSWAIISGN